MNAGSNRDPHIDEAIDILTQIRFPGKYCNERTALCLLALVDLPPDGDWEQSEKVLIGISPIMDWMHIKYGKYYKPNTRETVRKHSVQQLVNEGLVVVNPDDENRPVNSPDFAYQIDNSFYNLIRSYNSSSWTSNLRRFLRSKGIIEDQHHAKRQLRLLRVNIDGELIELSPGKHNELLVHLTNTFRKQFSADSIVVYIGDTKKKWLYCNQDVFRSLGVELDEHGKMPDLILFDTKRKWLFVIEAVTSHGPVDLKRRLELTKLFESSGIGMVFVTAFLDRKTLAKHIADIAWETEVWIAEDPMHLIHLNGDRFLGPHA